MLPWFSIKIWRLIATNERLFVLCREAGCSAIRSTARFPSTPIQERADCPARSSAAPEFHDRGIVQVFLRGGFDGGVGGIRSCGGRELDASLLGEIERQAHVLVHQAQGEAGWVFALH